MLRLVLIPLLTACSHKPEFNSYLEIVGDSGVGLEMQAVVGVDGQRFWIAAHETTWELWTLFQYSGIDPVDGVSGPTPPYVPMDFGMGIDGYPAISMTHYSARQFCRWLSNRTGHFYRLPTADEWITACADSAIGWHHENSDDRYQQVAQLKPNKFGIHDMLGNVAEWVDDPPNSPTRAWGQQVFGGGWDDERAVIEPRFSRASKPDWQRQDPQIPKSIWHLTNAQSVGFRVVRPMNPPDRREWDLWWSSQVESINSIHSSQQRGER